MNTLNRFEFCISTVRNHLISKKIKFIEYTSEYGSHYFHLTLDNNSAPCIRISDHAQSKQTTHCQTILWNVGKNTKLKKLKQKIIATVDNTINRSNKYSLHKTLEGLRDGNRSSIC